MSNTIYNNIILGTSTYDSNIVNTSTFIRNIVSSKTHNSNIVRTSKLIVILSTKKRNISLFMDTIRVKADIEKKLFGAKTKCILILCIFR